MSHFSYLAGLRSMITVCGLCLLCTTWMKAQLFPGLEGEDLVTAIQGEYTPAHLLTESQVKDTLYAKVFIENDSVRCIYSGIAHYLPHGVDPSQWVYGTGNEIISINLEHGYPQAKGAGEGTNGNMDMHHLFPSRVAINSDRADYPYSDIDDNATQKWYYLGQEMSTKPASNIDAYSEFIPGFFEPRESVKGDIARAMFYFWTIYRDDAVAADPLYFDMMRPSICQWQDDDPVDDVETTRNERIAFYQDGKLNPFILDCTLAKRAYCPSNPDCGNVSVTETGHSSAIIHFDIQRRSFRITSQDEKNWELTIVNMLGQPLSSEIVQGGQWSKPFYQVPGIYIVYAKGSGEWLTTQFFIP